MLRFTPQPNNKGFAYSPFILSALVLVALLFSFHFAEVRDARTREITYGSEMSRAGLDLEEARLSLENHMLSSAESAIDSGLYPSPEAVASFLEDDLRSRSLWNLPAELSSSEGDFTLIVSELPDGRIGINAVCAPHACVRRQDIVVCKNMSVGGALDREWIF